MILRLVDLFLRDLLDRFFIPESVDVVQEEAADAEDSQEGADFDESGEHTDRVVRVFVEGGLDLKLDVHHVWVYEASRCATETVALGIPKIVCSHRVLRMKPICVEILIERCLILINEKRFGAALRCLN